MLSLCNVSKTVGKRQVLSRISLDVKKGTIVSVVGSNGAGKTTLFRILAKAMDCTCGEIIIDGIPITSDMWRRLIGWVDETEHVIDEFSVLEFISFISAMRERMCDQTEVNQLLKEFNIWDYRFQRIAVLSQGMKKKVAIVAALVGHPKLLILDEPTNALDTSATISLKKQIMFEKERGSIILLSSHVLDFVERISDQIVFLHKGHLKGIVNSGTVDIEEMYNLLCVDGDFCE